MLCESRADLFIGLSKLSKRLSRPFPVHFLLLLILHLQMLVKQKEANRQSMILLQSAEPSVQLLKALEDVAVVTKTLEEERLQHQQKVRKKLEFISRKWLFDCLTRVPGRG